VSQTARVEAGIQSSDLGPYSPRAPLPRGRKKGPRSHPSGSTTGAPL